MTNTKKLREAITQRGVKYKYLAQTLGISPYGLQKKIENDSEFKASEVGTLTTTLRLSPEEKEQIFFA